MKTVGVVHMVVTITVQNENWNENTTAGQLHREAGEAAIKELKEMCGRTRRIELIGEPQLVRVYTEDKR